MGFKSALDDPNAKQMINQWNAAKQPNGGRAGKRATRGAFRPPVKRESGGAGGGKAGRGPGGGGQGQAGDGDESPFSEEVLRLLGGPDGEIPEAVQKLDPNIVNMVCNDVMERPNINWDDIVGQDDAKQLIREMVVWPILNPGLFSGVRTPPKGLLLFGPPGTGKTLLGKAIASNIKATFFNVSSSSLTSKWIGEGEKLVKALFTVAGCVQPSVIFIDEIDSILSARKAEGEHEASRRLKTELLVQIEGCDPTSGERKVLIVGATNRPEELDEAARRRLPKQLYIPLPCDGARHAMVMKGLGAIKHSLSDGDLQKIVAKTEGYSGADMKNFLQEACQGPVRAALSRAGNEAAVKQLREEDLRPVRLKDFKDASKAQKASVSAAEVERYAAYDVKHGASYANAAEQEGDSDEEW